MKLSQFTDDGYALLPQVFSSGQVAGMVADLERAFSQDVNGSTLRCDDGRVYGARNLLELWPGVAAAWRQAPLPGVVAEILGSGHGLVRVLYFDKPPEQSWALPWHKDMTIAVRDNRLPSVLFSKPTFKVGVPHVEAPLWLLEKMLTLRLHLDDMTEENGPLKVLPGSHRDGKTLTSGSRAATSILGGAGDVLVMRPLLTHCSHKSVDGTRRHRRILHLEFAGDRDLPDGYAWHDFVT